MPTSHGIEYTEETIYSGVKNVHSDLDSSEISDILLDTFKKFINFALGKSRLGGNMVRRPSGRLAAALRGKVDKKGDVVALYIDKESEDYIQNEYMFGHKGFSLKRKMLQPGKPGVKTSKAGHLYRYIPISNKPSKPSLKGAGIANLLTTRGTGNNKEIGINKNLTRMWTSEYTRTHGVGDKIRTMSNKRGSARWYIPSMPIFHPGDLLRKSLPKDLRSRVMF